MRESDQPDSTFRRMFRGHFQGVISWQQLDSLWDKLRTDDGRDWFIYAVGEAPPPAPVTHAQLVSFIDEIDALLRREHDEEYCGIVYADERDAPTFIKIFDPNNLGVVCGYSDNPPLPGWILSLIQPEDLDATHVLPGNRRRWWQRLFPGPHTA